MVHGVFTPDVADVKTAKNLRRELKQCSDFLQYFEQEVVPYPERFGMLDQPPIAMPENTSPEGVDAAMVARAHAFGRVRSAVTSLK